MKGLTIHRRVRFPTARNWQPNVGAAQSRQAGRIPRVARLVALAIRLERMLTAGVVPNCSVLADLGHVSRARVTQITHLTLLAPDIQEAILFLPPVTAGRDPITERDLRPIAAEPVWSRQRELWSHLRDRKCRSA